VNFVSDLYIHSNISYPNMNEVPKVHEEFGIQTPVLFGNLLGGGFLTWKFLSHPFYVGGVDYCVVRSIMNGLTFVVVQTDRQTENLSSD